MFQTYFAIAIVFFIINGLSYNLAIMEYEKDFSLKVTLRTAFVYVIISLFWPLQLAYLIRLFYEGLTNGKSD